MTAGQLDMDNYQYRHLTSHTDNTGWFNVTSIQWLSLSSKFYLGRMRQDRQASQREGMHEPILDTLK